MGQVRLFMQPPADEVGNADVVAIKQGTAIKTATRAQLLLAKDGENLLIGTDGVTLSLLASGQVLIHDGDPVAGLIATINVPDKSIVLEPTVLVLYKDAFAEGFLQVGVDVANNAGMRFGSPRTGTFVVGITSGSNLGRVAVYAAGLERMSVVAGGQVGIGTNAPVGKLDVAGEVIIRGQLRTDQVDPAIAVAALSGTLAVYDPAGVFKGYLPLYQVKQQSPPPPPPPPP